MLNLSIKIGRDNGLSRGGERFLRPVTVSTVDILVECFCDRYTSEIRK